MAEVYRAVWIAPVYRAFVARIAAIPGFSVLIGTPGDQESLDFSAAPKSSKSGLRTVSTPISVELGKRIRLPLGRKSGPLSTCLTLFGTGRHRP